MSEIDGDTPDIAVAVRQELRSPLPERQGTGEMMGITDGNAEPGAGRGTGRHRIPAGAGAVAGPVWQWGTAREICGADDTPGRSRGGTRQKMWVKNRILLSY